VNHKESHRLLTKLYESGDHFGETRFKVRIRAGSTDKILRYSMEWVLDEEEGGLRSTISMLRLLHFGR
jgi:hypothetical protein